MSALTIHHLQTSQSERVVWLCEELHIPYTLQLHQRAPLLSPPAIRALHPLGAAPIIQDGPALTLAESGACVEYIIHKHGGGRLALPPSHPDYASYLYWFHFSNGTLLPALGRLMYLAWGSVGADDKAEAGKRVLGMAEAKVAGVLRFVDARLGEAEWFAGDEFTAADVMMVFCFTTFRTFYPLHLAEYPNILAYLKRATDREAYKEYRRKADPDLPLMIDAKAPEQLVDQLKKAGKM